MARIRAKQISGWLQELACENDEKTGWPRNKSLAAILYKIAFDDEQPTRNRLDAIEIIMDRLEGKPMQTNLNAEITSPFSDIPTDVIEALRARAAALTTEAEA